MFRDLSVAILCVLTCAAASPGDEIQFKNGDRLSGQIVRLTGGKLVFKSPVVGEVTVNLSDIRTFSSTSPIEVHLQDGTVLHQPIAAAEPNEFAIAAGEPLRSQTFQLTDIASINPPPAPRPKWTGSVSGSLSSAHGNTTAESVTASVSASRRTEKDRTTADADYATSNREDPDTGQSETVEDWWRAKAEYDYFFTKKFFGFGSARYEKDDIARLDRRIVVGGGGGYQWIETDRTSFYTNFGLASLYEKFDNQTDSNSELSFQAGYSLSKKLWENLRFVHNLTYYPSLSQFSDYYLTTTGELRTNLTKSLFANFKVIFNYDTTPAAGQGSSDVKYLLGVGLTF